MAVLLTRRAVLLAKIETTYNVEIVPSASTDAILVESPEFMPDMTVLKRNFARSSLSPLPHVVGRKFGKMHFTTELRGNGTQQSGSTANAPVIARLFQACGYSLTGMAAVGVTTMYNVGDEPNLATWVTNAAASTATDVIQYIFTVDTGGASLAARITVTSDTAGEAAASQIVTSGSAMTVGTKGITFTPTFTGALVVGQQWVAWALPKGQRLDPISTVPQSLTMRLYLDGTLTELTGAYGTFSIDAIGGQYAKVKWEFTGQYVTVVDAAIPTATFERTLPLAVQLARLNVGGFSAVVNAMTWTQANDVQLRPDVNQTDAYNGVRIVTRTPQIGIDPEADLVANHDFWGKMAAATRMPFQMRIGNVVGNTVWMLCSNTQYDKMTYKDRNGIRTFDAGLSPVQDSGDDEVVFVFS